MKTIAICNQKGGVGKTSTAVTLASMLGLGSYKTLLVDLDPQGNATSGLGIDKRALSSSVYNALMDHTIGQNVAISTAVENLFIMPSNIELTGAEVELVNEMGRETRLKKAMASIEDRFDFVIIDCPPSLGLLTINALTAAQSVLIPIQCEYYALEGLGQLIKTIELVRDNLNESLYIEGILMTMADNRTNLTDQVVNEVKKHFPDKVYGSIIPRSIRMGEAPGFGKPIIFYDKNCTACKKYEEFFQELLGRCCNTIQHKEIGDSEKAQSAQVETSEATNPHGDTTNATQGDDSWKETS